MHVARAFVAVSVLFAVALAACSAPASMASSEAPVVAALIVKPRIATSDSAVVLRPIQAALGETAGVKYVRPMAGDAHIVHLTAPAQRADVPKLVERVRASGTFRVRRSRFDDENSMTRRTRQSLKGNTVSRHLFALAGAFVASVAFAVPSAAPKMTAKQAALRGQVSSSVAQPEQMVSRLIVKMRSPSPSELAQPMSASRMQALSATAGIGMKSVRAMAGTATAPRIGRAAALSEAKAAAARLASDPSVEYAEPDIMFKKVVIPNEPRFDRWQWNLFAPTSTFTGAGSGGGTKSATATGGANLPLAWDVTTGASSVVIAIIDTGIVNHPDLNGESRTSAPSIVPNRTFLAGYDFISGNVGAGGAAAGKFCRERR